VDEKFGTDCNHSEEESAMQLYFVRHGRAEDRDLWPAPDHLRPLTADGINRMQAAAKIMRKLEIAPVTVLTSPLVRARQTAEIVAEALDCGLVETQALAPGFGVSALAELLPAYPDADSLLLVGHEPDFSLTVESLMAGGRVTVKKGSLIRVDLFSPDPPRGTLAWIIPPKMLML